MIMEYYIVSSVSSAGMPCLAEPSICQRRDGYFTQA